MAETALIENIDREISEHPAAVAWRRIAPHCGAPHKIAILKNRGHSKVYRLDGAGPRGDAVIAKTCRAAGAEIERAVYENIFPVLPVAALKFYGSLREDCEGANDPTYWLFLEDAGGEKYSDESQEHRTLAGRWLGALHSAVGTSRAGAHLPSRGPEYYLETLRAARGAIHSTFADPALTLEDLRVLETLLKQYEVLEKRWSCIVAVCDGLPKTLVHGDLAAKNARVRSNRHGLSLVVLDWETAGWGVPAVDLAQFAAHSLSPDLAAYWAATAPCWVGTTSPAQLAGIGSIFRFIASVCWERDGPSGQRIERTRRMRFYQDGMAACLRELGWGI